MVNHLKFEQESRKKYYSWTSGIFCGMRCMCWLSKTVFRMHVSSIPLKWEKTEDFMFFDNFWLKIWQKCPKPRNETLFFPAPPEIEK